MRDLAGLKALVVEDEGPVAMLIEDMLMDLGCEIAASASNLGTAIDLVRTARIDFALLDLNLNGESAVPVATILRDRNIPLVFSTGYGASGIAPGFERYPLLAKPFDLVDLHSKISAALESHPSPTSEARAG